MSPRGIVALVALQNAVFVIIGALLWHFSGRPLGGMVRLPGTEIMQGAALGGALALAAWAFFRRFRDLGERLVRLQADSYRFLGPKLGWPAIVAISLAAGIGEEALLRGGVQTFLADHLGPTAAILLASALFAAIHLARPMITVLLFAIGVVFGIVYWTTGSLLVVMLGHALYDVWALRYLHGEFVRLGLFDPAPSTAAAPLVNSPADR